MLSIPVTLAKTISKLQSIPNSTNAQLIKEMYEYLKSNGVSERHQNNALKVMIPFANYLGPYTTFFDINSKKIKQSNPFCIYVFYFYGFCQNYSYSEGAPCPVLNYYTEMDDRSPVFN